MGTTPILGSGAPISTGMALAKKLDKKKREVQLSIKALEEKESKEALKKYLIVQFTKTM